MKRGLILTGKDILFLAIAVIIYVYAAMPGYCSGLLEPNLWIETFDDPALDGFLAPSKNSFTDIQQTSEGGYIVAGETDTPDCWNAGWVVKLERNGDITWQKSLENYRYLYPKIQQTDDGYILFGNSHGPRPQFVIMMLDQDGEIVWLKDYQQPGGGSAKINMIQRTGDGGYIAAGYVSVWDSSSKSGALLMKLDHKGEIAWQKVYSRFFRPVILHPDVQGFSLVSVSSSEILMMDLDQDGNIVSQKKIKINGLHIDTISETMDQGYVVIGHARPEEDTDGLRSILRLDADGNIMWQRGFPWTYRNAERQFLPSQAIQTSDGGYVVLGRVGLEAFLGMVMKYYPVVVQLQNVVLLKLNPDGAIQWLNGYGVLLKGEEPVAIHETDGEGLIVAGSSYFDLLSLGIATILIDRVTDEYGWVMKLDKDGLVPGCPLVYNTQLEEAPSNASTETHTADITASPSSFVCTENNTTGITETAVQPRQVCAGGFELNPTQ